MDSKKVQCPKDTKCSQCEYFGNGCPVFSSHSEAQEESSFELSKREIIIPL